MRDSSFYCILIENRVSKTDHGLNFHLRYGGNPSYHPRSKQPRGFPYTDTKGGSATSLLLLLSLRTCTALPPSPRMCCLSVNKRFAPANYIFFVLVLTIGRRNGQHVSILNERKLICCHRCIDCTI